MSFVRTPTLWNVTPPPAPHAESTQQSGLECENNSYWRQRQIFIKVSELIFLAVQTRVWQLNRWPCHLVSQSLSQSDSRTYRVTLKTCDLWDIWSERWEDMTWSTILTFLTIIENFYNFYILTIFADFNNFQSWWFLLINFTVFKNLVNFEIFWQFLQFQHYW